MVPVKLLPLLHKGMQRGFSLLVPTTLKGILVMDRDKGCGQKSPQTPQTSCKRLKGLQLRRVKMTGSHNSQDSTLDVKGRKAS